MPAAPANAKKPEEEAAPPAGGAVSSKGGIKPWLPLLANLIVMPIAAYLTVVFVLGPKLNGPAAAPAKGEAAVASKTSGSHGAEGGKEGGGKEGGTKAKVKVPLKSKVLVNLAGSQGTRYLMASITLVGSNEDLKKLVADNDDELRDAASTVLGGKTISDLEKPGAKNMIRAELISVFSNILGSGAVEEILLTEFAIQ
jgi:flagellar protein FliL